MKLTPFNLILAALLFCTSVYIFHQCRTIRGMITEMEGQDKVISNQQGIIKKYRENISKETITYSKTKGYSI